MAERVASGEIYIGLNQREVESGLASIDREFHKTMRDISNEEAKATVDADLGPLEDKVRKIDRIKRKIQAKKASLPLDADTTKLDEALVRVERARKRIDGKRATLEMKVKGTEKVLAAERAMQAAAEKRIEAVEKREARREKLLDAAEKRRLAAIDKEARRRRGLEDQRLREFEREHAAALKIENDRNRAEAQMQREMRNIPKMRRQYAEMGQTLERLGEARRKASRDEKASLIVDLKIAEVVGEMKILKDTLERVGSPIDLDVDIHPGRDFGNRIRSAFKEKGILGAAHLFGMDVGDEIGRGVKRRFSPKNILGNIGGGIASIGSKLGRGLSGLSEMTVRLGPFTATIRQLIVAMSIFAPLIIQVVGALGSLVAVAGSAAAGMGALGAAAAGGGIPVLLGMGLVIKGVVNQFSAATKASKAYNDAIMKGKTDLAATKLKELHSVLGNVNEETVQAFKDSQNLNKDWTKLTAPGRASAFNVIGRGIAYARDNMGWFGAETNRAMGVAEKSTTRWIDGLDSAEGRDVLGTMMGNFTDAMGPALDGLGNFVAYLGKVGQVASRALPGLARQFKAWTERLFNTTKASNFDDKVNNAIESVRRLGAFLMAGGRLMKAFFSPGVSAGQDFLTTMTKAMTRWTEFLNTGEGQANMANFFDRAVKGAQNLWANLAPIVTSFVQWAANMAPFVDAFLKGTGAVAGFVAAVLQVTGLRGPMMALATTLGALWAVNKISGATRAVTGFVQALLGLKRAQAGVAATGAASNIAQIGAAASRATPMVATPAAMRAVPTANQYSAPIGPLTKTAATASRAAKGMSALRTAGGTAITMLTGLNPVAGAAVLGVAALSVAIYKSVTAANKSKEAFLGAQQATDTWRAAIQGMPDAHNNAATAVLNEKSADIELKAARKELNDLASHGKKGTDEWTAAQLRFQQAQVAVSSAHQQAISAAKEEVRLNKAAQNAAETRVKKAREAQDKLGERDTDAGKALAVVNDQLKKGKTLTEAVAEAQRVGKQAGWDFGKKDIERALPLIKLRQDAEARLKRQMDLSVLATLNQRRAAAGLAPVAQQAAAAFANLKRNMPKTAARIALKFDDPGQAAKVAQSASKALKAGVPNKIVTKIVTDSKTAEEAIRRINRMTLARKILKIVDEGGDRTLDKLEEIIGRHLTPKEQKIFERGGQDAINKLQKILGIKLSNKDFRAWLKTNAPGLLAQIQRGIDNLHNKTVTMTVVEQRKVAASPTRGPTKLPGHKAAGRAAGDRERALVGEGKRDEWLYDTATGAARKTNGPQIVDLKPSEAVLPTEDRYKHRSASIIKGIAKDIGIPGFAASKKPKKPAAKPHNATGVKSLGDFTKTGAFNPKSTIDREATFKPSKSLKGKMKTRRGWADYVEDLQTQQGNWEREVSIRESKVKEPENFVVRAPENDQVVTDPLSGEKVRVEAYKANPEIESSYKPALRSVLEAMATLVSIVQELVRAIPNAISANKAESSRRKGAIDHIEDDLLPKAQHRAHSKKKKVKAAGEREVQNLKERRDEHKEVRSGLIEDQKTLAAAQIDAGFDYREAVQARNELQVEHDTVMSKNQADAKAQTDAGDPNKDPNLDIKLENQQNSNKDNSPQGLTIGGQNAAAAQSMFGVLQGFGGNASGGGGGNAAAVIGAGIAQGMMNNPAALGSVVNSSNSASSAVGSAVSGGAAAGAVSSGGAAGTRSIQTIGGPQVVSADGGGTVINKTVNVVQNNAAPPADPTTWSSGVKFQLEAQL